jgi:anaphase-promoting complex subunit 5
MSRYLNPAKVGLLALIELYTEDTIPPEAILPVLSFITSHLIDLDPSKTVTKTTDRWAKAERIVSFVVSLKDFEKLLSLYPVSEGLPGRRLWDIFLIRLWSINSLHALHEFFERLAHLPAKTKQDLIQSAPDPDAPDNNTPSHGIRLSRSSPFGTFVRRANIEFSRLRFHDATDLWRDYVRYRQPSAVYLRRRNPSFARLSFDAVLLEGEQNGDWGEGDDGAWQALAGVVYGDMLTRRDPGSLPVSTDDVEALLEFQITQMQSRSPISLDHSTSWLAPNAALPKSLLSQGFILRRPPGAYASHTFLEGAHYIS